MAYDILLIDDEQISIDTTIAEFENEADLFFFPFLSPEDAIAEVKKNPDKFAVVLLDYNFSAAENPQQTNGALVAKELLSINQRLNVVILSGDPTRAASLDPMRAGAADFLDKSVPAAEKIELVRSYCRKFDEVGRVVGNAPEIDADSMGIIGKSEVSRNLRDQIRRIRESSSTVLILGESGTGKELVARAVHENSLRRGRPFIPINCGAIPENLIESELFGHEKGSFTGADTKKIGKFQLASGGTIFLDEIGDMPLHMQVKLLRVLQEGTIDPLGGREPIRVNVRVIAATNVQLENAVKEKKFREDLYYRLNVIPLEVPPLRERREDIEPLVAHFVRRHAGGSKKKFLAKTMTYFFDHPWNGNIRELENTVVRALTLATDDYIGTQHLGHQFFKRQVSGINFDCTWKDFRGRIRTRDDELERQYLLFHLSQGKSVRYLASNVLKMPNTTLQVRLKELGIDVKTLLKGEDHDQDAE